MGANNLDHRKGIDSLATEINDLKRQLREMRTLQLQGSASVNMQSSGLFVSGANDIANGDVLIFRFEISNIMRKMVFATFHYTVYEGTWDPGQPVPRDKPIGHFDNPLPGYRIHHWTDWEDIDLPNKGYSNIEYVWVQNNTGSPKSICMAGEWRYLVNGGVGVA